MALAERELLGQFCRRTCQMECQHQNGNQTLRVISCVTANRQLAEQKVAELIARTR